MGLDRASRLVPAGRAAAVPSRFSSRHLSGASALLVTRPNPVEWDFPSELDAAGRDRTKSAGYTPVDRGRSSKLHPDPVALWPNERSVLGRKLWPRPGQGGLNWPAFRLLVQKATLALDGLRESKPNHMFPFAAMSCAQRLWAANHVHDRYTCTGTEVLDECFTYKLMLNTLNKMLLTPATNRPCPTTRFTGAP